MSEPTHVTVQVSLASQLHEQARAIRDLRAQLEEKEKTKQLLLERIVELEREIERLKTRI